MELNLTLLAAHIRTLQHKIRKSPMKDNRVRFAKASWVGVVMVLVLAACGGNGGMYTMTGGMNNGMGGMSTPSSVALASPGATVNRTVSLTAMATAGTGVTISRRFHGGWSYGRYGDDVAVQRQVGYVDRHRWYAFSDG
jgi:hypothetical protein